MMTRTRRSAAQTETAGAAFERNRSEALKRLAEITAAVTAAGRGRNVNWSDAGSMAQVNELLGQAGHYAGVERLTER